MRLPAALLILLPLLGAAPAHAAWHAANADVTQAAKNPRIAAALEATNRMEKAILSHDVRGFANAFADDAVVNNPFNKIARKADAENNLKTGLINYTSLDRSIEYAAIRGQHDIVLMGEEKLTPVGKARFDAHKAQYDALNKIYGTYFSPGKAPSRACMAVEWIPGDSLIEMVGSALVVSSPATSPA